MNENLRKQEEKREYLYSTYIGIMCTLVILVVSLLFLLGLTVCESNKSRNIINEQKQQIEELMDKLNTSDSLMFKRLTL